MEPLKSYLFSLLFLLLLPHSSLLYSLKNCTADFYDQNIIMCDYKQLITIPTDIPKSATNLSLKQNHIERIKQTDLTGLTRLKTLNMRSNAVSHIEDGAFQELTALTKLMLSINKLTDLTDNMFKGLSNLVRLSLLYNQIEHISKLAFEPLKKLQVLDLSLNQLVQMSDLVNIVVHCPLLYDLDVSHNVLNLFDSGDFPFPLQNLMNLDLQKNVLTMFRIDSDKVPHLESINLSAQRKTFKWDVSDKALKNLKEFALSFNNLPLETYQIIFQNLDSLQSLYLTGLPSVDKSLLDFACAIPSLQLLDLSSNRILILNNTFLQPCPNLTALNLRANAMSELFESSLRMLTRLTRLDLESNQLSRVPVAIRNITTLKALSFESNDIRELQCLDFLNLPFLTELNLKKNKISKLSSCVFSDLHNLRLLNVENNFFSQFDDHFGEGLDRLVVLNANQNSLGLLQKDVFKNMSSLTDLSLISKGVTNVENGAFEGLFHLKRLTFSVKYHSSRVFTGLEQLKQLTVFISEDKKISQFMDHEPMTFTSLQSLSELTIEIDKNICSYPPLYILDGLKNLRVFSLDTSCFDTSITSGIFYSTPHLLHLQIIHSDVFNLDPALFQPIPDLQVLDLSHNKIQSLDFLLTANLTKLEKLILVDNNLLVINMTVFKALPSLKFLNLSGNSFVCECSNAEFIQWVIRNKQVQVVNAFQYRCLSPVGRLLLDFNVQFCWDSNRFLCFISSCGLVLVTLLLSFIYHFMRWQLVYGFYLFLAFLYNSKKRRQGCPHVYDAFVSYNVRDEQWVYRELLPELEGQQGWKLCLHHRDFQPGKPIIENITDAIYSSRKTLCVISRRYLQSEWCSREIQMASFRLFDEQKDVLILLFLEEISSNQLSPFYRMRKLVKSRTYLSWTQAQNHKGMFWEKVRRALESGNEPGDEANPLTANV